MVLAVKKYRSWPALSTFDFNSDGVIGQPPLWWVNRSNYILSLRLALVKKKVCFNEKKMKINFLTQQNHWFIAREMKLNIRKIELELNRIGKNWFWLASEIYPEKYSWNKVKYWRTKASIRGAVPIGRALGLDPKDLIE